MKLAREAPSHSAAGWSRHAHVRGLTTLCLVPLAFGMIASLACFNTIVAPPLAGSVESLPVDELIPLAGLSGQVDVVRDLYGMPHIYADNYEDLYFAFGFVEAMDRFPALLVFRAAGTGTAAELGGGIEPNLIDQDIITRYMMTHLVAQQMYDAMAPDSDERRALDAFAAGVNAWRDLVVSGAVEPTEALSSLVIENIRPWTAVDSLAWGRLVSLLTSYTADIDILMTTWLDTFETAFNPASPDPALAARAGFFADLVRFAPADPTTVLSAVPNVPVDKGTSAAVANIPRPMVSVPRLESAYETLQLLRHLPGGITLGHSGSNGWLVDGSLTSRGFPIIANDPHFDLVNPPMFYEVHLELKPSAGEELAIVGAAFSAIPIVLVGHNNHIGWGFTNTEADVSDAYDETVVDCNGGTLNCVMFEGQPVEIVTWTENISVGLGLEEISDFDIQIEVVPHHGPLVPNIVGHLLEPRTTNEAISTRWTGHEATNEFKALIALGRATDIAEAEVALDDLEVLGLDFSIADVNGDTFYTASAKIPLRDPSAYTWEYDTNPTGAGPAFVLDGASGMHEWIGYMDERYLPHAVNPPEGFIITANNAPVPNTLDNNPWLGDVDGVDHYFGYHYGAGFRAGRIKALLEELTTMGARANFEELQDIQKDTWSPMAAGMVPYLLMAMQAFEDHLTGAAVRLDLEPLATGLSMARIDRLRAAIARLSTWDYSMPDGIEAETSPEEVDASVAASIFGAWRSHMMRLAFDDEKALTGYFPFAFVATRALNRVVAGDSLRTAVDPVTGPVVFDDLNTMEIESRDYIFILALDQALDYLESTCARAENDNACGFGTPDMDQWRWGVLHTLRLKSLIFSTRLDLPVLADPVYGENGSVTFGYPMGGDIFSIVHTQGGNDLFDHSRGFFWGPVVRWVMEAQDGVWRTENALPGGNVYDPESPHYADQLEMWRKFESRPVPFYEYEVVAAAESRLVLVPAE